MCAWEHGQNDIMKPSPVGQQWISLSACWLTRPGRVVPWAKWWPILSIRSVDRGRNVI